MTSAPLHALHTAPRQRPTSTPKGIATAHFGELRQPLLRFINGSDIIVGCVAWVTERTILEALAKRPVCLVVQKENWWKKADVRGQALARRYAALRGGLPAVMLPEPLSDLGDLNLAPISCVGYGAGAHHQPLMHHKFVVRCSVIDGVLVPLAVWTGSFNFSGNANDSFENAVEIHDPSIAEAYLAEFALVASVAEPMNWRLARPTPKGAVATSSTLVASPRRTATRTGSRTGTAKTTKTSKKAATRKTKAATRKTANPARPKKAAAPLATRRKASATTGRPRRARKAA
ncbi:phospholipase D-like domain-containing protein [Nocardioides pakistanensis]